MTKIGILGKTIVKKGIKIHTIIKRIIVVLFWNISIPERLIKAEFVISKLTSNPKFPLPYPANITTLAKLVTDTHDFDLAIVAAKNKVVGSAEALKIADDLVHMDLISIMSMVQSAVDADRVNGIKIANEAGFDTKKEAISGAGHAEVKRGAEPGVLIAFGDGPGYHDWLKSDDGGATWERIAPTRGRRKTERDLVSDKRIYFRSRLVLKDETYGEWSAWVSEVAP